MFFLVQYRRSCEPNGPLRVMVISGPDNDHDACEMFRTFEPHAIEVNAKCMRGEMTGFVVQSPEVLVVQPRARNPFSNN